MIKTNIVIKQTIVIKQEPDRYTYHRPGFFIWPARNPTLIDNFRHPRDENRGKKKNRRGIIARFIRSINIGGIRNEKV